MVKQILLSIAFLVSVVGQGLAESAQSVERATRFRADRHESSLANDGGSFLPSADAGNGTSVDAAELAEPGGRLQVGIAAQLDTLGSRYAVGWSNSDSQLDTLGSRYAVAYSNSNLQLDTLGSRYAVGWSNSAFQLPILGSRYAVAWSNHSARPEEQ